MKDSKLKERALRAFHEWASMDWYEHLRHRAQPKPPYYETHHPRSDFRVVINWLRIRSNPFRRNYH